VKLVLAAIAVEASRFDLTVAETEFYAAAERRIWWFQLLAGVAGAAGAWALAGAGAAAGFAAGAGASALNFLWLKQAVDVVVEKATAAESPGEGVRRKRRLVVWKFLARYLVLGGVVYAILNHTSWNVKALLAGLFVFVAAILAEIGFEILALLLGERHGRA
jgi:hypothetical protein